MPHTGVWALLQFLKVISKGSNGEQPGGLQRAEWRVDWDGSGCRQGTRGQGWRGEEATELRGLYQVSLVAMPSQVTHRKAELGGLMPSPVLRGSRSVDAG